MIHNNPPHYTLVEIPAARHNASGRDVEQVLITITGHHSGGRLYLYIQGEKISKGYTTLATDELIEWAETYRREKQKKDRG